MSSSSLNVFKTRQIFSQGYFTVIHLLRWGLDQMA